MAYKAPKGTQDLLPSQARAWNAFTVKAADVFSLYGYEPIETPAFEKSELFLRGCGETCDAATKEIFSVFSVGAVSCLKEGTALKSDQKLALRPEGTASVVRAIAEHNLVPQGAAPVKLFYAGPMYRCERPQKGRLREFHQIGVECLGASDPAADAELIVMFVRFIEALGIEQSQVRILINSMGDDACRPAYRDSVAAYIREHSEELCEECRRRADTNPLRAFDCKNDHCHEVMEGAPKISDALCPDCRAHYEAVKRYLDAQHIAYVEDPRLVRGLDYYTRTVFEVQVTDGLGSQNAIGGGGRYDKLVEVTGGKPTPGLGFAAGFERIVLAMQAANAPMPQLVHPDVFVAQTGPEVSLEAFCLVQELRDAGFIVEADRQGRSLKSQFKLADKYDVDAVVVLGPDELAAGQCTVRDMASHEERKVALADVAQDLAAALGLTEGHGDGCGCGCGCHDGECDCDGDCDCGDECTCGHHQH